HANDNGGEVSFGMDENTCNKQAVTVDSGVKLEKNNGKESNDFHESETSIPDDCDSPEFQIALALLQKFDRKPPRKNQQPPSNSGSYILVKGPQIPDRIIKHCFDYSTTSGYI
ncbi:protein FAM63A, partial [Trifolium medium]|nr:protein FAM63A [Trifolium medium]